LNGIDVTRFRVGGPAGSGPVVAIGRFSPEKDFLTLVRAAAIAIRGDPSFRLEIAGDGVCMPEIKGLITKLNLNDAVRLLGQVQDIPSLLGRACAFALSSVTEGISLTIMEAMASGLPVIATRVGGNPEVVADKDTGLLVPAGDPEAMAEALLLLWHRPEIRTAMGQAARARVEKYFDVRKMVASYEQLYLERNLPRRI